MDKFRTEIQIPPSGNKICHESKGLLIGSCFSENIGKLLMENKFNVDINPTGIVYNPLSVATCLTSLLQAKEYQVSDLIETNGRYVSFDHHGHFSDPDPDKCLNRINSRITEASVQLQKADYIILTFGTAWVYRLADSGKIVSNNHKLPARLFTRELLKVDVILSRYQELIQEIRKFNPEAHILFTVSPVRHWKDGARLNTISKSTLVLAIHELTEIFECTEYFPAYELAMDDLRDYRFYEEDMIHPNAQMTNYIWKKFSETYFSRDTLELIEKLESLNRALNHKPYYPGLEEHRQFVTKQLKLIADLSKKYPYLNFNSEIEYFEKQISSF